MEQVDLSRYQLISFMGSGADYEVRLALDKETGQEVVVKRPLPQLIMRQMHHRTNERTQMTLDAYRAVGPNLLHIGRILGYSEQANHDAFYGDKLNQEYRVIIMERARGIPLVGDVMARIRKVPIGAAQNLFALFPLRRVNEHPLFAIQEQLLAVEAAFWKAGYVLLDLRPQNVFYRPADHAITIVDCGDVVQPGVARDTRSRWQRDIHDFYLEMLKFYATPLHPPARAEQYREALNLQPSIEFEMELDKLAASYGREGDAARDLAVEMIDKARGKEYASFDEFHQDYLEYLRLVQIRHENLPNLALAQAAWGEALGWLRGEYWRKFLFDPDAELKELETPG